MTAIQAARLIADAFERSSAPLELMNVSSQLDMPQYICEKLLDHLVAQGILIKTTEPRVGYVPARSLHNITLDQIAEAVRKASYAQQVPGQPNVIDSVNEAKRNALAPYTLDQLLSNDKPGSQG